MSLVIWKKATLFAAAMLGLCLVYGVLYHGRLTDWVVQEAFAVAAVLVIAPSLALSGIAYFWNFGDRYIMYRKSLGLLGYYLGLTHVAISLSRNGSLPDLLRLENAHDLSILAGYVAVILFALMPAVSNVYAVRRFGAKFSRVGLRYLGYTAYVLVLLHAAVLLKGRWFAWLEAFEPVFPPPTLIAFVLGMLVLLLRVALFLAQLGAKRPTTAA